MLSESNRGFADSDSSNRGDDGDGFTLQVM